MVVASALSFCSSPELQGPSHNQGDGHLYTGRVCLCHIGLEVKCCLWLPFPELLKDECLNKDLERNTIVLTGRTEETQTSRIYLNYFYIKELIS